MLKPSVQIVESTKQLIIALPDGWTMTVQPIPAAIEALKKAYLGGMNKITAIKSLRLLVPELSLYDAKQEVESWVTEY